MQVTVSGYRGIDRADLAIAPNGITAIFAKNAQGKSSLLEALTCLVQANGEPLGLKKKDLGHVIHDGMKTAEMKLETPKGIRKITLSPGSSEVKTLSGTANIDASSIALGLTKVAEMSSEDLSTLLTGLLAVSVDKKRLSQELIEIQFVDMNEVLYSLDEGLRHIFVDTVFGTPKLSAKGWVSGAKVAEENATIFKRQWQSETGKARWDTGVGMNFTPAGWEPDLATADHGELATAVTNAREELERSIAKNAIGEQEHEALTARFQRLDQAVAEIVEWDKTLIDAGEDLSIAEGDLALAKSAVHQVTCGECGSVGRVQDNVLVSLDAPVDGALSVAEATTKLNAAKSAFDSAKLALSIARSTKDDAVEAGKKLEASVVADGAIVAAAREKLANAEARLTAFNKKKKGVEIHFKVLACLQAAELMGPEGLQKRVMLQNIERFNADLAEVCSAAGWNRVSIESDLGVRFGVRPYRTLSQSEKYRVNATLQIAIAQYEKAHIVMFDAADVLDRDGRNELFRALTASKRTAVVAMTWTAAKGIDPRNEVPRLASPHASYWIEEGKLTKLEPVLAIV